jgi:hypothetical protein
MKFIKLHTESGNDVIINVNTISAILDYNTYARIWLIGDSSHYIDTKESAWTVFGMIRDVNIEQNISLGEKL